MVVVCATRLCYSFVLLVCGTRLWYSFVVLVCGTCCGTWYVFFYGAKGDAVSVRKLVGLLKSSTERQKQHEKQKHN